MFDGWLCEHRQQPVSNFEQHLNTEMRCRHRASVSEESCFASQAKQCRTDSNTTMSSAVVTSVVIALQGDCSANLTDDSLVQGSGDRFSNNLILVGGGTATV